jgi:hypothetical protein
VQALQIKHKTPEEALEKARFIWEGNDNKRGESEDPHFDLCFRSFDPLDAGFENVSRELFAPLLRCMKELSDDA